MWVSSHSLCLIPLHISLSAHKSFSAWNFPCLFPYLLNGYTEHDVSEPEQFSRNLGGFSVFLLSSWFIQVSKIPPTHRQQKHGNSESGRNETNSLVRQAISIYFCSFTSQRHWLEMLKLIQLLNIQGSLNSLFHTLHMAAAIKYSVCLNWAKETFVSRPCLILSLQIYCSNILHH